MIYRVQIIITKKVGNRVKGAKALTFVQSQREVKII